MISAYVQFSLFWATQGQAAQSILGAQEAGQWAACIALSDVGARAWGFPGPQTGTICTETKITPICEPGQICALPPVKRAYQWLFGLAVALIAMALVFPFIAHWFY